MNILIKVSGDVKNGKRAEEFIRKWAKNQHTKVVLIVRAGTEISRQLQHAGFKVEFDEQYNPTFPRQLAAR